ncbi:hypothetical protein FM038_003095 [Shewanella eurypsychrophilus]|uniref:Uncharacterized protein n=1 Tax=Shewanella eurypsychrophilus TaxID=2593656 RepID=A0ABX6V3T3_9GAMM|nr:MULTISPECIES: hypothetical protein [Shewanella]QFU21229.1 hypothetical protein FS418_04675 [Shewanella sp. YLB-09]QPG56520.1 hypothetical protein FM038_003095 [Shewanella eurypsychrophilus]
MRTVRVDWYRLLGYSLLFLLFSLIVTIGFVFSLTGEMKHLLQLRVHLSGIELAFSLAMFISIPVLMFRFSFFFYRMVKRGRRNGIGIICYQNLFNPFNFLLFPSLLNHIGLESRRRCIVSVTLLLILYLVVFFDTQIKPALMGLS